MELIFPLLFVVVAFYVILLRPVMNQQRRRRSDLSSLRVGDEVLTSGGFYGLVRAIRTQDDGPQEILIEVAPGVELRATPDAIQTVTRPAPVGLDEALDMAVEAGDETDQA
ncbi:MAG: preprotein translocase subunit YajC [Chloroflexi bacterium]|nr:preprotein translocase subunit YajC [Chloroflexota bacterium]